ncbi:MAG: hypothetical protein HC888_02995 [Candidatus Competibacteraceae bacterium]|nr:hypothetical protein [Candidatus Competibacteraceae bacterium]
MTSIKNLLTDKNLCNIVKELADRIDALRAEAKDKGGIKYLTSGKVDFAFNVSAGKLKGGKRQNTFVMFDLPDDSVGKQFIKAMYAEELSDDGIGEINDFVNQVAMHLIKDHINIIRDAIRQFVIPDSEEQAIPLADIKIIEAQLVDYSSVDDDSKYLLRIFTRPNGTVNQNALMSELARLRDENPGMTNAELTDREIANGNPAFSGVAGIDRGERYLFDVSLSLYVDYSYSEEFVAQ